jgi:SAM-dependent methyltransferase
MPETLTRPFGGTSSDAARTACPSCGSSLLEQVYAVRDVPVHSVLLIRSHDEALRFPTGALDLVHCRSCDFLFNARFNESKLNYGTDYEETQGFSDTFNAFHRRLAAELIERFDLRGKDVLEIGCGKGDFLTLLCRMGGNRGVGFDPAFVPERSSSIAGDEIRFIQDFYSEKYADFKADFICCKMTLEHIPDVAEFVGTVRRAIGSRETTVFFQIPDMSRVLEELAFWDVYYEHCSYFTATSLRGLFERSGFHVQSVWTDYDGQYLMIEATPAGTAVSAGGDGAAVRCDHHTPYILDTEAEVPDFRRQIAERLASWRSGLADIAAAGKCAVLWGGGSKAVAFLTTLGTNGEIAGAVDINPYKHGTYLARTGHPILSPDDLLLMKPDVVIVMNPIYREEIARDLAARGLSPFITDITRGHLEISKIL